MSEELKPCPFCGDEPTLRKSQAPFRAEYMVICARGCGACNGWKDTVDEAIAAWNTRNESDDVNRMRNLLAGVVNALDLPEIAIEIHGVFGTEPAELVKLVLQQKDREIALLHHEPDELPEWFVDAVNERINELQAHCDMFRDIPSENDTIVHATFLIRELYGLLSIRKQEENK